MSVADDLAARALSEERSRSLDLSLRAEQLAAAGRTIVPMAQGQPDFLPPPHVVAAAQEAIASKRYSSYAPAQGIPALRQAVARKIDRDLGLESEHDTEILITNGAQLGIFLALMVLLDPGDEVLLTDPHFGPYRDTVVLAGGRATAVPMTADKGRLVPDVEALAAGVGPRTRALIINSPCNPTGTVLTRPEIARLVEFCLERELYLLSDEVYEKYVYDGREHISPASMDPAVRGRIVLINSLSKTYSMTGWRVGYLVADQSLVRAATHVHQRSARCATHFVQVAGAAALDGPEDWLIEVIDRYRRQRDLLVAGLNGVSGVSCHIPEGSFYVFADVRRLGLSSLQFAEHLLETGGVVANPGSHYGAVGEGYVRFSFASTESTIRRGLEGVVQALARLDSHGHTPNPQGQEGG